jgi:hypothetical protein
VGVGLNAVYYASGRWRTRVLVGRPAAR